jgi:hypothetical protein
MDVYNSLHVQAGQPTNQTDGFGTWIQEDPASLIDLSDLDFTRSEIPYFTPGNASTAFETAPFQCAFSQTFDSAGQLLEYSFGGTTNTDLTEDVTAMCGLIGVYIDTTTVDDTLIVAQSQDWKIEISVDVESWKPIVSSPRRRRSSKKSRRRK